MPRAAPGHLLLLRALRPLLLERVGLRGGSSWGSLLLLLLRGYLLQWSTWMWTCRSHRVRCPSSLRSPAGLRIRCLRSVKGVAALGLSLLLSLWRKPAQSFLACNCRALLAQMRHAPLCRPLREDHRSCRPSDPTRIYSFRILPQPLLGATCQTCLLSI